MTTLELHNGDCLEVMKGIPDKSIDLILCDLPFGCLEREGRSEESRKKYNRGNIVGANSGCPWDIKLNLQKFWEQIKRLRRSDSTPCIMFCTTKFGYELIQSNPKEFRYDLVWSKPLAVGFLSANKMPMRSHEMIYVFSKIGAYYNRIDIEGDFKKAGGGRNGNQKVYGSSYKKVETDNTGKRCIKSVIETTSVRKKGQHPTEKPMELYRFLIERYCPVGGTVLDPTAGSCNSVVSAYELNRNAIGIEMDKEFYDKASERLDSL